VIKDGEEEDTYTDGYHMRETESAALTLRGGGYMHVI
jgi:hypothetical protein